MEDCFKFQATFSVCYFARRSCGQFESCPEMERAVVRQGHLPQAWSAPDSCRSHREQRKSGVNGNADELVGMDGGGKQQEKSDAKSFSMYSWLRLQNRSERDASIGGIAKHHGDGY